MGMGKSTTVTPLFGLERGWTNKLGTRSVHLSIRYDEPPTEHRYENWIQKATGVRERRWQEAVLFRKILVGEWQK